MNGHVGRVDERIIQLGTIAYLVKQCRMCMEESVAYRSALYMLCYVPIQCAVNFAQQAICEVIIK